MNENASTTSSRPARRFRRLATFCLIAAVLISIVLFRLLLHQARYSPPSAGLVAWWRGDGNADDSAGAHHGILRGGMSFRDGLYGQAFAAGSGGPSSRGGLRGLLDSFMRRLGYVRTTFLVPGPYRRVFIPDSPDFQLTSLSMGAWINAAGPSHVVFFRGDNRTGLDPYHMGMELSTGKFAFGVQDANGGATSLLSPSPIPLHQWVQYTGTLDAASGDMRLYMNGSLVAQTNTSVRPFLALDPSQVPGLGIGNVQDFYDFPFNGGIDEVVLYNRALSPAEVLTLARRP